MIIIGRDEKGDFIYPEDYWTEERISQLLNKYRMLEIKAEIIEKNEESVV